MIKLSPRMRGWSWFNICKSFTLNVIPANAGVILRLLIGLWVGIGYPRECGGDPQSVIVLFPKCKLSPRMRGWSWDSSAKQVIYIVIPANAGVILCSGASEHSRLGYPRECGGDPIFDVLEKAVRELSPRMRGWSWSGLAICLPFAVIPANAGVILSRFWHRRLICRYPRECGGDPIYNHLNSPPF